MQDKQQDNTQSNKVQSADVLPTEKVQPTAGLQTNPNFGEEVKPNVVIYSTPSCHFCHLAKEFFKANGVMYTEYDVASDLERQREMIEKSGQMGVPVIFIGQEMVIGFYEPTLRQLLGLEEANA